MSLKYAPAERVGIGLQQQNGWRNTPSPASYPHGNFFWIRDPSHTASSVKHIRSGSVKTSSGRKADEGLVSLQIYEGREQR